MGVFFGKARNSKEYVAKIGDINSLGVPKDFVSDLELIWATSLRLTNYNPVEAKKILNDATAKEIYEAYVMYAYDNFPDG